MTLQIRLRLYNWMMTILTTISAWIGYYRGVHGSYYYLTPIQNMQTDLIDKIYTLLNGHPDIEPPNPMSIVTFIENNENLKIGLTALLVGDKYKMGRETDATVPSSIYSYAYVAASILLDPAVDADLTYGLSNVSKQEYLQYYSTLKV